MFNITFAEATREHIKFLSAGQRAKSLGVIERQLSHQPQRESRNQKLLRPNPLAPWELRVGNIRIFYEVIEDQSLVRILAIGCKIRDKLWIAGEKIEI